MQTVWKDNQILLRGRAAQPPRFSHRNHDAAFWLLPMEVRRLSGAADLLNVLTPEPLLAGLSPSPGTGWR